MQSQIKQAVQHCGLYKATCCTESLEQAAVTQPPILTRELNLHYYTSDLYGTRAVFVVAI